MAGSIRPVLAETVTFLKEAGQYEKAAAVEAVTGPRGYLLLQRTEEGDTSPLSLTVQADLAQALRDAAEEFEVVLDALAEEAYRLVLDGEWLPPAMGRSKGGSKATVQLQVDKRLRQDVQAALARLKEEAGYKITESNIALSHICEELGIERSNTAKPDSIDMRFPKSLVGHWKKAAKERGVEVEQVAEDGIRALLDGSWQPGSVRRTSWSESGRQRLWLPMDENLLTGLRAKADALSEQLGYLVYPGAIVRAILTDRLGEPAAE
ncbi:hypothetical protein [Streptomyces sp. NPDC007991]|uniref:hypothetical protein n=1 Tax=Streptomyces sp. NPDC007991 TaxID=3364803 RepID=UPI0036E252E7